jgi:hypothetical protein
MSALKDPSSFAPPPKKVNYSGAAEERAFEEGSQKGPLTPANYRSREEAKDELENEQRRLDRETKLRLRSGQEGQQEVSGSLSPYRNDSTGLSTTKFAPPIARGVAADGSIVIRPTAPSMSKSKPSLPPRLPDRQNSNLKIGAPSPPPTNRSAVTESPSYRGQRSQVSLDALDATSVSTPSLKIGSPEQSPTDYSGRPRLPARTSAGSSSNGLIAASDKNPQLNELQSRFARMRATSPTTAAAPTQNAVIDASNLASTSNNVRERYGAQVATGRKPADRWNQKYKKRDDTASYTGSSEKDFHQDEEVGSPIDLRDNTMFPVKKAPPPIPKKRAELFGASTKASNGPPPLPLFSKPK